MAGEELDKEKTAQKRKRDIRRTALLLGAVALAFYLGFIMISAMSGQ